MHSRSRLTEDFRSLGVVPGDVVMLHASIRSVGPIAGGPDEIHLALKDALTESGTMLMYAGCPRYTDEIGRGNLTLEEEREILEKLPPFDPLTARAARDNGALVELFRTYPGTRVNAHVARFAAWGRHVDFLFSKQPWNYAFGRESPLERFAELNGKILLLGSDHDNVTFLHYPEHIVDIPDKLVSSFRVPVMENGRRVWKDMEEFDTAFAAHGNWPENFFERIVDSYIHESGLTSGKVGDATSVLIPAKGLLSHALPIMKMVAENRDAASRLTAVS